MQTPEDVAREFGFDLDSMVKVADIRNWLGRSSSNPAYAALKANGATVVDFKTKGVNAARVILQLRQQRFTPAAGNEDLVLLTRDGNELCRLEDNKGTGSGDVKSTKVRHDSISSFVAQVKRKLDIKSTASSYKLRHSFQTYCYTCPSGSRTLVEFMMGHLSSKLVRNYFRDGLLDDNQLVDILDHVRGVVMGVDAPEADAANDTSDDLNAAEAAA